ncbi:hypothetical protein O5D80_000848 [Batrachochytrium dendrobatidis]|nr:hypothetical protein O5D80_000848 [Batrachochytrium dendrobatidis]
MKLSIVVLSSILAICSVTTANPVVPSATTSAGASTSTIIPSAQTTPSIDFSQLPEEGMDLIKEYVQTKKSRNNAKEMHDSLQLERLSQKKLVEQLGKEIQELINESGSSKNGSKHKSKLKKLRHDLKQERKSLHRLTMKLLNSDYVNLGIKLGKIQTQLLQYLFGENLYQSAGYYTGLLESTPEFMKLVSTLGNSVPNQQPGSEQASTSETQNQSQHHKSSSSSSKRPTI